ncbi:ABC transporter substrate-binding protein [Paenibacillus sp. GXUN7292]|uniref:ABC transporter substrate-binding protein n=1 Tax=Paenibacillus sp. GXUN7292 TaxID=3422499 RepID=UPI003D7CF643
MIKKTYSMMLVVMLAFTMLVGCASNSGGNNSANTGGSSPSPSSKPAETQAAKKDPVEIELVHYQTGQEDAINQLLDEYFELTGVKVKQTLIDAKNNQQYLITRAQEKKFPDIYAGSLEGELLANLVNANLVENLLPEWEAWGYEWLGEEKSFKGDLAADNPWGAEPGKYGIPYMVATSGYYYNKKMLNEAGFEKAPATWNEFLDFSEKVKAKGVSPIAYDFGDNWGTMNAVIFPIASNIFGGEENLTAALKGDGLADPKWLEVFNKIAELRDKKYLAEGTAVLIMSDAEKKFINEEVAVISNGSWFVPVLKSDAPDLEWLVALPPAVNANNDVNIDGGVSISFTISKNNKNMQETKDFIKWFVDGPQQIKMTEQSGILPANSNALTEADLDNNIKVIAGLGEKLTKKRLHALVTEANIYEEFWKGVQALVEGKKSPEQLQQDLIKVYTEKNK